MRKRAQHIISYEQGCLPCLTHADEVQTLLAGVSYDIMQAEQQRLTQIFFALLTNAVLQSKQRVRCKQSQGSVLLWYTDQGKIMIVPFLDAARDCICGKTAFVHTE